VVTISTAALGSLVLGFTQELFEPTADDEGTSAQQMAAMAAALPHLAQLAKAELHATEGSLSVCDTRAEFEFTLDLIPDGLEARRPARANAAPAEQLPHAEDHLGPHGSTQRTRPS
jgi:hypothetical protein